jgi:epoxyqueuosine reductase
MPDPVRQRAQINQWAKALGFAEVGFSGTDLKTHEAAFQAWLDQGFHGEMSFMASHGLKRLRPTELVPGTKSIVCLRLNYLPTHRHEGWREEEWERLADPQAAVVSIYARGRDYHKVLRQRLRQLAQHIETSWPGIQTRVFTDSAPVAEATLAVRAGLGWRGKNTLVLHRQAGSFFFLGEIYLNVDLSLPIQDDPGDLADRTMSLDSKKTPLSACGSCQACLEICPTKAILAPYQLDARRCISYLTIEHQGSIPKALRPLIGNRIYGCDDCQLVCPWNKFARRSPLSDFDERHGLGSAELLTLWGWDEADFDRKTQGSSIRRIGYERWLRNLAVALGNALSQANKRKEQAPIQAIRLALARRLNHPSVLVREHVSFGLGLGLEET